MRLLLALLAVAATALAKNLVPEPSIVFTKETHPNFHEAIPTKENDEPYHLRVKRAIFATLGIASACEPGWTGQFCENPMCSGTPAQPSVSTYFNRLVDQLYLPSGCTGKYYIPVDSMSAGLNIQVAASGFPYINVSDAFGNLMIPDAYGSYSGTGVASYPITMPPGGYQLTIDNGGVPTTDCIVTIEIPSWLAVSQGFSMSPFSDVTPMGESAYDSTPMYFISQAVNVTSPGNVKAVTIRTQKSMDPAYRSVLTPRYGCGYPFYAGQFVCDKNQRYTYHIDGIDQNGYPWRRTNSFGCLQQVAPVTTTQAPLSVCYNGGTLLRPNTVNASCFCPELFTGLQCQQANCMNFGILAPSGLICICPDGYSGDNCQHVTCDPNLGQFLVDFKTLVVVIRTTTSMNQYINTILNVIRTGVEHNNGQGWNVYNGYVLIRFGDDNYLPKYYPQSAYSNFLDDVQKLNASQTIGNCSDTTFDALYSVFIQDIYEKSPIYFFTDAIAKDSDNWRSVTESNSRRKLPLYTFFMPQAACNFDSYAPGYRAIQNAAALSGGLSFMIKDNDMLANVFQYAMRSTAYMMNLVMADDLQRCSMTNYRSFMIDSSATDIIVMATGNNMMLNQAIDPNGIDRNVMMPIYGNGGSYFWEVAAPMTGEYLFQLSTADPQAPCSYRVMARSQYDLFFATSISDWNDAIDSEPVVGQPVHLVAQLNGLVNATADPFRLFAELTVTTNRNNANQVGKPMYYSNGRYRDGCGYHLYFGVANFCEYADQPFYATVYADDNNGFTIQRTNIGYCSLFPTTTAPPGGCQNGGVLDPTDNTNSTCVCPAGFIGDFCQTIVCQNGGTPAGSLCICGPGTAGTFCEQFACPLYNNDAKFSFEGQSLVLVVSAKTSMTDAINQLANGITDFVRDVQAESSTWITRWGLIYMNYDEADVIVETSSPMEFVNGVKLLASNLSNYLSANEANNCSVQLQSGLLAGAFYSLPKSSVYAIVDSDGPDTNFLQLFSIATQYQLTLNLILTNNTLCTAPGNNGWFPDYIQNLIIETSGFSYVTPNINGMLQFITTFYKSGMAGVAGDDDCTKGITAYLPVDAWTQSFTLAITGGNVTDVKMFRPDGQDAGYSYLVNLVNDPYLVLDQYINACPQYWNSKNGYCYTSNALKYSWSQASSYCHNSQAYLVDVHSQDKDDYVHMQTQGANNWIGLIRHQDTWVWDVPNNNNAQPLTGFTKWCTNFPTADTTKNCVMMDPTGCWQNIDCNTQLLFMCQKHRYGQGLFPDDNSDQDLPDGRWKVQVTTQSGGCYVQMRAQSDIQVFFGFVQDPHSDFPEMYANSDAVNYLVANPTKLDPYSSDTAPSLEGRLNYAIMGNNNTLTNPLALYNRQFCNYPMVSTPFTCQFDGVNYFVKFSGVDQFGNAFNRYTDTACNRGATTCQNGGFVANGLCVCQAGWLGSRCQTPICQNQGEAQAGACKCQPMFTGTFCEQPYCEPPYPAVFGDSGRTLAILLETSYNMGSTIFQMKKNLKTALDKITQDPTTGGWFSKFILYPFDSATNKASWYPIVISSNSDDIVNAVKNIPTMTCPGNGVCSNFCPRPIMGVLNDTLNMADLTGPNSVILVVTRSSPEDWMSVNGLQSIIQQKRPQINFVLPAIDSPCSEGWNADPVSSMYRVVSYSDGNLFVMSAVDFTGNFMQQYVPSLYRSAGLESAAPQNCSYTEILFQVEHAMYEFTVDYYTPLTDPPMIVTLTDPAGDVIQLPDNMLTSDSNYLGVIAVNDTGATRAGTYRLSISGGMSTFCYLNVRGRSATEFFPAYVNSDADAYNGATNDAAYFAPGAFQNNTVVIHADKFSGQLTYAQIISNQGLEHTSTIQRREKGCSYEWYATVPFECQSEDIVVIIYGKDELGASVRRTYQTSCVANTPIPKPPPAQCDLTAVMQDTLFIIDSSLKDNADTFNTLTRFASSVMQRYKLSSNYTMVGALTVSDQAYGGFSYLASENNWQTLNTLLTGLNYSAKPGQNTTSAFQMVLDKFNRSEQGYRPDQGVRHLIVYLTATNPTDDDPAQLPYSIRRSGLYGLVVIGYNMTPNNKLTALASSQCTYIAQSSTDLGNYATNFLQQKSCTRNAVCGM